MDENKNNAGKVVSVFLLLFFTVGQVVLHYTYYDYILPAYKYLFPVKMTTWGVVFITLSLINFGLIITSVVTNKYKATVKGLGIYILSGMILLFFFGSYLERFDRVLDTDVVYPDGVEISNDTIDVLNRRYDSLNYIYSKGYHYY